jgi:[acyl-carrier-protein] S-malonyltransferase
VSKRTTTAVVICPGRGSYNESELGYLHRLHGPDSAFLDMADAYRRSRDQATVRELDSRLEYSAPVHAGSENAGPLVFCCSYCDFLSIDRNVFQVVAITGNSMGWYTALTCAGALREEQGVRIVNSMGAYLQETHIGSQAICSTVDEEWLPIPNRREELLQAVHSVQQQDGMELYVSIELGGMIVFSGSEAALAAFLARVQRGPGKFPMRLRHHGAYHSPLQAQVSARAKATLPAHWFRSPAVPIIDGCGRVWLPHATDTWQLWDYTLGTQVLDAYDFTRAIQIAVREFTPDCLIVLGPGDTLGSAVAQSLIQVRWRGLDSKRAFVESARVAPWLLSMGREDQRRLVVAPAPRSEAHVLEAESGLNVGEGSAEPATISVKPGRR